MVARNRQATHHDLAYVGNSLLQESANPVAANSIPMEHYAPQLLRTRFLLEGKTISIAAANDYGSLQLCDFPNKNLLIAGAHLDLDLTVAGFGTNQGDTLDWALGTVAITSLDFSNSGEDGITDEFDGTGGAGVGAASFHTFDNASPALIFLDAAASNDLFLNAQGAVTSGTGVITFLAGSFVDIFYWDLGE